MDDQGYLPLARKFLYSDLWREQRMFSRAEAWLDLLFNAKYRDESQIVEGRCLSLRRGELVASVRYSAARWHWNKGKVERFYDQLRDAHRIRTRVETGITIVTILNYRHFNDLPGHKQDSNRDTRGTLTGHARDNIEERKKETDVCVELPAAFPKQLKDALTVGEFNGIPSDFTEKVYDLALSRGGRDHSESPIRDFGAHLRVCWKYEREKIHKNAHQRSNNQNHDRNAGTANAGKGSQYAGIGKSV